MKLDYCRNFSTAPQAGHEQMGNRPALVVSHDGFNQKMSFAFVCSIGNTKRQNHLYVRIPDGEATTGVIMTDQTRSLDFRARDAKYIGECPDLLLQDVFRITKPILY